MTPARQPPNPKDEFIITREEMKWIHEGSQMDVIDVLEDAFKRPHTSAPALSLIITDMEGDAIGDCSDCEAHYESMGESDKLPCGKAHDAQVAKAERERVLDDLVYWMYDCPFGGREGSDRCHTILAHKIESLRHQQGNNNRMEQ